MRRMKACELLVVLFCFGLWLGGSAEQCGVQNEGKVCPNGKCCSVFGWCGDTQQHCGNGCQSQCHDVEPPPSPKNGSVADIVSDELFEQMLYRRNDPRCPGYGFYSYDAFVEAASHFPNFGMIGNDTTRKRELAAFFGQTSHQTTGGPFFAHEDQYEWGYCFVREVHPIGSYCVPDFNWPCSFGQKYYGRGPIQLSYNYNYGPAGEALGQPLLNYPDLVEINPMISFETAIWFWMTPQGEKPSIHDVITGKWEPSDRDKILGRFPGYGITTNIINGKLECGRGPNNKVQDRIGFYKRYCDMLEVDYGDNLDCYTQAPFFEDVKLSNEM